MGRRRKPTTKMVRIRLADLQKLKAIAKSYNLSLPDYLSMVTKNGKGLK